MFKQQLSKHHRSVEMPSRVRTRYHFFQEKVLVYQLMRILAESKNSREAIFLYLKCLLREFPKCAFQMCILNDDYIDIYSCVPGNDPELTSVPASACTDTLCSIHFFQSSIRRVYPFSPFPEDQILVACGFQKVMQFPLDGLQRSYGLFRIAAGEEYLFARSLTDCIKETMLAVESILHREKMTETHQTQNIEHNLLLNKLSLVGEMSASIAHEVRNPMTTVRGLAQILTVDHPEKADYYQLMIEEIDRANQMLSAFLNLAKNTNIAFTQVTLADVLRDSIDILYGQIEQQGVRIFTDCNEDVHLYADRDKLIQVFVNILRNALEASPSGSSINITVRPHAQNVNVSICDEGSGIDDNMMPQIMDPFFTTKDSNPGLGLSVAYKIIKDHGGDLWVDSFIGRGTVVEVRIPLMPLDF